MTREEILTLAKAGFNYQQIVALGSIQAPQQQVVQAPPQQAVQTAPQQQTIGQDAQMNELLKKMGVLTQTVQANAILASNQPQVQQTTDDVLAQIINPPTLETGKKGV